MPTPLRHPDRFFNRPASNCRDLPWKCGARGPYQRRDL